MSIRLRFLFFVLMLIALAFGFLHLFADAGPYRFERLHVFLFNLCCGGTIILYFTEGRGRLSARSALFLGLAISYAIVAFFQLYPAAIALSLVLSALVETYRIQAFSLFPVGFFKPDEPISRKFHQASLLCLSLGLLIATGVMLNNEYLKLIQMPKLQLDVFFLGFSFPVSLITLSLIFSFINHSETGMVRVLKEISFWAVNLGVIIFFLFIIFEQLPSQVGVTAVLFAAVVLIFFLYRQRGENIQQKHFLTSGMWFLLATAVTGIAYIFAEIAGGYTPEKYHWLLKVHAFASLYGWNLCGLAVICRYDDFPINLHAGSLIGFHWITVMALAPLGVYFRVPAVLCMICYVILLYFIFFSKKTNP
ncbi:MAG: hypothetical protein SWH61_15555 [Thermodesulfobacteriota bacterium]|nr:hypothetical protein [Thermodesulfobacteriota bacterium]